MRKFGAEEVRKTAAMMGGWAGSRPVRAPSLPPALFTSQSPAHARGPRARILRAVCAREARVFIMSGAPAENCGPLFRDLQIDLTETHARAQSCCSLCENSYDTEAGLL